MTIKLKKSRHEMAAELREPFAALHRETVRCGSGRHYPAAALTERLSLYHWHAEQRTGRDRSASLPPPEQIFRELYGEACALKSEYGSLILQGLMAWFALMGLWVLLQQWVTLPLRLTVVVAAFLGCTMLYPVAAYAYWNGRAIHPFKMLKLTLSAAFVASAGLGALLSVTMNWQQPILRIELKPAFNVTTLLILINAAVFLGFVAHYRRANLLSEVTGRGGDHLLAFSRLNPDQRDAASRLLETLEGIPLKTQIRRRLKARLIAAAAEGQALTQESAVRFLRTHCVAMNWLYWCGSAIQWALILLLLSKLVWTLDTGLLTAADYFRQELSTGAVLGAVILSSGILCPLNYGFRELLYLGRSFSLREAWLLTAMVAGGVGVLLLSGLVPSRFLWGAALNPAPRPGGLLGLMALILVLQFLKAGYPAGSEDRE